MAITVTRESENTRSRLVTLTYIDQDNDQIIAGSERSLPTIDVNHLRLHEGRSFFLYENRTNGSPLADDDSIDFVIASGSGTNMHMTIHGLCGGDAELYLYEGATASGGTSATAINRNRTSSNTSNTAALIDPTVSVTGTELFSELIPGGTKKQAGGGSGGSLEYILLPLTNYLIRLTNVSGLAQYATLELEWYE